MSAKGSVTVDAGPLTLTSHPLQRAGAWAVAVMAGRQTPEQVKSSDLDTVAARIVTEACAAAVAQKDASVYDWWKVLFALYPNAKVTHASRPRYRVALEAALAVSFTPDDPAVPALPCTFCGADATAVWAKSMLPMFDTNKALNTLPPGVAGWPVCRGCRIAVWALPYGSWVTAGSATVLSCEKEAAERQFAERNVRRARRIMHVGFSGLAAGARPELVVLRALRTVGPELCATTLWSFKNDNQDPWLRVTRTRRAVPAFLAAVEGNAPLRRGWRLMELALTRRDASGAVIAHGAAEAARLLFDAEDGRSRSVLQQTYYLLRETDASWSLRDHTDLNRLALTYAKEILGMNVDLTPVATVIADWIEQGSSPRGRFAEYRNVALSDYKLGALLMQAQARLMLDGRAAKADPDDWRPLIQQRPRAWEQRMLLFASVTKLLAERGVAVGVKAADPGERERTEHLVEMPVLHFDDDDEMEPA